MFISADTMAYLFGLGLQPEELTELVRRLDDDAKAMQPVAPMSPVDSVAERKRAADRERMREKRQRENVARQSRDVACDNSDNSLSLPLSPQTPQSPTHTREYITTRTREAPQVVAIDGELLDLDEPEKPVVRDKRGTRLPDDWTPSPAEIRFAAQQNLTLEETSRVAENFRDYWIAKPGSAGRKLDWPATWRNWVRSHVERGKGRGMASRPAYDPGGGQGATDFAAIVARNRGYTPA